MIALVCGKRDEGIEYLIEHRWHENVNAFIVTDAVSVYTYDVDAIIYVGSWKDKIKYDPMYLTVIDMLVERYKILQHRRKKGDAS